MANIEVKQIGFTVTFYSRLLAPFFGVAIDSVKSSNIFINQLPGILTETCSLFHLMLHILV